LAENGHADPGGRNTAFYPARLRSVRLAPLTARNGCGKTPQRRQLAVKAADRLLAVDKPLHIHRMRCAEQPFLQTGRFFSNIGASPIQSLSRALSTP
jgi:hypothetical protein